MVCAMVIGMHDIGGLELYGMLSHVISMHNVDNVHGVHGVNGMHTYLVSSSFMRYVSHSSASAYTLSHPPNLHTYYLTYIGSHSSTCAYTMPHPRHMHTD